MGTQFLVKSSMVWGPFEQCPRFLSTVFAAMTIAVTSLVDTMLYTMTTTECFLLVLIRRNPLTYE